MPTWSIGVAAFALGCMAAWLVRGALAAEAARGLRERIGAFDDQITGKESGDRGAAGASWNLEREAAYGNLATVRDAASLKTLFCFRWVRESERLRAPGRRRTSVVFSEQTAFPRVININVER